MLGKTTTIMLSGMEGYVMHVECDVSEGLPGYYLVGYLGSEVREGKDRVLAALKNSNVKLPAKKVTMNFTPAGIHKTGTAFDLPMAMALTAGYGLLRQKDLSDIVMLGEVTLNGKIEGIRGVLPMVLCAKKNGFHHVIVPKENLQEASLVEDMRIFPAENIKEVLEVFMKKAGIDEFVLSKGISAVHDNHENFRYIDFSQIKGQAMVKRACEVAASGRHNLLMVGPPGTGKSMIAKAMAGILPPLTREEQLEVTSLYSISGYLDSSKEWLSYRPFRMPHHKTTAKGLIGGGNPVRPGEISLANRGVLFLDELPEFGAQTIEALRQPLEEGVVRISRASGTYCFPADITLVAAMNPCPCGFFPNFKRCRCTHSQIHRYLGKISGPLLDRFDMCVQTPEVDFLNLKETECETSEQISMRVAMAHQVQKERLQKEGIFFNGQMKEPLISRYCALNAELDAFMKKQYEKLHLSARTYHRILKVARTIADMNGHGMIEKDDLVEALCYREDLTTWS